jgi:hypothetical protein
MMISAWWLLVAFTAGGAGGLVLACLCVMSSHTGQAPPERMPGPPITYPEEQL